MNKQTDTGNVVLS